MFLEKEDTNIFKLSHVFSLQALTKDSLTVSVDAIVYYKICDPVWAVINIANHKYTHCTYSTIIYCYLSYYLLTSFLLCRMATQFLAATTLRNAIGTKKLPELLKDRPAVSYMVFQHMMHYAREWGIEVVRVEM